VSEVEVFPFPGEFGGRDLRKNTFITQNPVFLCILGSENAQLLTGTDLEGTAGAMVGWRRGDAEGVDVQNSFFCTS